MLTALSRNRRAADLVDTIQPVFRLYEQTCLSESSLWYRKRPGKRTKAAPVLVQETEADTAAAAKAAALLRSEYGRGAIAAYVQGWLGESDVCRSEDIPLENDKDYVMSLLAVLTGGDRSADFTVQELDGERRENGYAIPELQISRKEKKRMNFGISEYRCNDKGAGAVQSGLQSAAQPHLCGAHAVPSGQGTGETTRTTPFCPFIMSPCASISACLTGICGATT